MHEKSMSYEFTLWVRPGTSDPDAWANAVYEAGGDDTLVGRDCGQDYIRFDRDAATFDEAVRSAVQTVHEAGGQVSRLEVPEEQLAWAAHD